METPKAAKTATSAKVKLIFKKRGLSRAAVASMAGVKRVTLRQQLAKGFPLKRLRLVIEGVTDTPIWSGEHEFIRRKALKVRLGFDPWTVPAEQLRRHIPGMEIKGWRGKWRRAQLIELLEQKFLTANQTTNPKP